MPANRAIFLALTLLLLVRLLAMAWIPLTDPTEARYAEIARKMVETGNWITPQFDYGVPFWAKPPLHTWLSAFGIAAFGAEPFAARLGILAATIATLAILLRWGYAITDRQTAASGLLLTASSGIFFVSAAFVETDMILTLGVVASMAGFYSGLKGDRYWGWLFFLGIAIGLLGKGPVAVVLSMTPILVWMIFRGGWRDLANLPWVGGLVLCAALVLPWYAAAEIVTPGFLRYFLIGEHIERFLEPGWKGDLYGAGRARPRGTIWLFWIIATLPWSPLLPLLIWRQRKSKVLDGDGLHLYLLLFALTPLVFFTAAANILIAYVLPGTPAAAMLASILWTQTKRSGLTWLRLGVGIVIVATIGLTLVSNFDSEGRFLPSEAQLITVYKGSGRLAIFRSRSFSAEFYRQGKITRIDTLDELRRWLRPGDGVLVRKTERNAFDARFSKALRLLTEDQNYLLYVDDAAPSPVMVASFGHLHTVSEWFELKDNRLPSPFDVASGRICSSGHFPALRSVRQAQAASRFTYQREG